MTDPFKQKPPGLDSPAEDAFDVTPDDNNNLATFARSLWINNDGTVRVTTIRGTTVDFTVKGGTTLPVRCRRVHSSGTTSTNIVGLY